MLTADLFAGEGNGAISVSTQQGSFAGQGNMSSSIGPVKDDQNAHEYVLPDERGELQEAGFIPISDGTDGQVSNVS